MAAAVFNQLRVFEQELLGGGVAVKNVDALESGESFTGPSTPRFPPPPSLADASGAFRVGKNVSVVNADVDGDAAKESEAVSDSSSKTDDETESIGVKREGGEELSSSAQTLRSAELPRGQTSVLGFSSVVSEKWKRRRK